MKNEFLTRDEKNPLISPDEKLWKNTASFNGSPFKYKGKYGILYRAAGKCRKKGYPPELSTIGIAWSTDGASFENEKQAIVPEEPWEKFGCEDPRITEISGTYYIFYTAISKHPFTSEGIKAAVAVTKDFKTFEKHLVTPFNAKAACLFPKKIKGKFIMILNINSDSPPTKIVIRTFEKEEDIWNQNLWRNFYFSADDHLLKLQKDEKDHVEVGAPPVYTDKGWVFVYSYIKNYFTEKKKFTIETALLDLENPQKIKAKGRTPLLKTKESYEKKGYVPNVVFPTGTLTINEEFFVYYGGADTTVCRAKCKFSDLMHHLTRHPVLEVTPYVNNPILRENPAHFWEELAVLNPAAVLIGGTVHLFYRASDKDEKSVIGYAKIKNGSEVFYRSKVPAYIPREEFESFGCEDPRVVKIEEKIYLTYTGYDGKKAGVCVSSLSIEDLKKENWDKWEKPVFLSQEKVFDKNAAIFPKKINGSYYVLHRVENSISLSKIPDLKFKPHQIKYFVHIAKPRENSWDSLRIGISSPPIETEKGWLLLYHGISKKDGYYRVGGMLLDLKDPQKVLSRLEKPILEPQYNPKREAVVRHVVFPCGAAVIGDLIYVYYGEDDKWVSVGTISFSKLMEELSTQQEQ